MRGLRHASLLNRSRNSGCSLSFSRAAFSALGESAARGCFFRARRSDSRFDSTVIADNTRLLRTLRFSLCFVSVQRCIRAGGKKAVPIERNRRNDAVDRTNRDACPLLLLSWRFDYHLVHRHARAYTYTHAQAFLFVAVDGDPVHVHQI